MSHIDYDPSEEGVYEAYLRQKHKVLSIEQLVDGSIRAPDPLIEGLLLDRTVTMLSSEPYCGKTMLMMAMAISLATGKPLFGHYKPRELRRSLFLGQDAPTWDYMRQALKLCNGYGLGPDDLRSFDVDLRLNEGLDLASKSFLTWLQEWHKVVGFDVLFIDTLREFHTMNENDSQQAGAVMRVLKAIRDQLDVAVIFSHHTNKPVADDQRSGNYRARGSSTIAGSIDFHFQLARNANDSIAITMPKGRGADDMEPPDAFRINEAIIDSGARAVTLDLDHAVASEELLFAAFASGGPQRTNDLVSLVQEGGMDAAKARRWVENRLQSLKASGKIENVARGKWQWVEGGEA